VSLYYYIGTKEVKFRDETKQNENRKRSRRIIIALEENKVQENKDLEIMKAGPIYRYFINKGLDQIMSLLSTLKETYKKIH
jgi:hypothetical protein